MSGCTEHHGHLGETAFAWLPSPDGGHDHPVQDRLTRRWHVVAGEKRDL